MGYEIFVFAISRITEKNNISGLPVFFNAVEGKETCSLCVFKSLEDYRKESIWRESQIVFERIVPMNSIEELSYSFHPLLQKIFSQNQRP
jgi:hypothetical protein